MAIDRGPWNALIDDDGSNLTGSIWNKAAIKTVLLDPIDAALTYPPVLGPAMVVPQFTIGQIDNLSRPPGTTLLMQSTVPTFLTGMVAPAADGTAHYLINIGSPVIVLAHQFGSAVANQFIGAGFANTDLLSWHTLMVQYIAGYQKWMVLKP